MRVALVGLGNAGTKLHLPALQGIPTAEVVGACDPDAARRSYVAERWKADVFADFNELLDRARPEVVVVGTPPATHAEYCLRSLAAGAHVICEKPFASSVEEATRIIEAARAAGRRVALNHEFREMPIFRAVRDAVHGSEGREVVFAQAWQVMDLPPWIEPGWRGQMVQRTLYEAGVHLVDYMMALFGEKPSSVSATVSTCGVREGESDAVALVTLEFSRGRLAHIVQNRLSKGDTQYFEVRADTLEASYRASYGGRMRLSAGLLRSLRPHLRLERGDAGIAWKEVGHRRSPLAHNPKDPSMQATRLVFARSIEAFASGAALPASAEDGRDVLEVIAACYRSAAMGTRVQLSESTTRDVIGLKMGIEAPARA